MGLFGKLLDKFLGDSDDAGKSEANRACAEGQTLFSMGRHDEAVAYFDTALKHNPRHVIALSNKATVLHLMERYADALGCHQELFNLGVVPDPRVYYLMGVEQLKLGMTDEARESLETFTAQQLPAEDAALREEAIRMLNDMAG